MAERLELLRVKRQAVAAQAALAAESNAQVLILRAGQGLPQSSLRLSGPGLRWGLGGLRMIRGHWLGQSLRPHRWPANLATKPLPHRSSSD
jgi:hypothetical protein